MTYYADPKREEIRRAIEEDVAGGIRLISASFLAERHKFTAKLIQEVLSDLVAAGDLTRHYRVLCSGENQRFDVDREFDTLAEVPKGMITCTKCGDLYTPDEENISVFFEPTPTYLSSLKRAS